eukprot:scaffold2059_cov190-Amphora_coffeaeformis.AAC.1
MHSLNFRSKDPVPETGFGLDGYGFTHPRFYCIKDKSYQTEKGNSYCPGWVGSAKLFVKPKMFFTKAQVAPDPRCPGCGSSETNQRNQDIQRV